MGDATSEAQAKASEDGPPAIGQVVWPGGKRKRDPVRHLKEMVCFFDECRRQFMLRDTTSDYPGGRNWYCWNHPDESVHMECKVDHLRRWEIPCDRQLFCAREKDHSRRCRTATNTRIYKLLVKRGQMEPLSAEELRQSTPTRRVKLAKQPLNRDSPQEKKKEDKPNKRIKPSVVCDLGVVAFEESNVPFEQPSEEEAVVEEVIPPRRPSKRSRKRPVVSQAPPLPGSTARQKQRRQAATSSKRKRSQSSNQYPSSDRISKESIIKSFHNFQKDFIDWLHQSDGELVVDATTRSPHAEARDFSPQAEGSASSATIVGSSTGDRNIGGRTAAGHMGKEMELAQQTIQRQQKMLAELLARVGKLEEASGICEAVNNEQAVDDKQMYDGQSGNDEQAVNDKESVTNEEEVNDNQAFRKDKLVDNNEQDVGEQVANNDTQAAEEDDNDHQAANRAGEESDRGSSTSLVLLDEEADANGNF